MEQKQFIRDKPMTIRDLLREVLTKYGMTEAEVCRISGLSQSQLSRYLNQKNKKDIYVSTLLRIVRAMPPKAQSEFWWGMNTMCLIEDDQEEMIGAK